MLVHVAFFPEAAELTDAAAAAVDPGIVPLSALDEVRRRRKVRSIVSPRAYAYTFILRIALTSGAAAPLWAGCCARRYSAVKSGPK